MNPKIVLAVLVLLIAGAFVMSNHQTARAGEVTPAPAFKVLDPIRHGNLTVFPVVAAKSYPTNEFLTLDEGLRSGDVVVTEAGSVQGLIRRHGAPQVRHDGAEVNRLVLVNNSKRPLLLLAGEIVSGGKQDRVIGKDRIIPAESDPIDLSVFCVEPGRWVATSEHFGASEAMYSSGAGGIGGPVHAATPPMISRSESLPITIETSGLLIISPLKLLGFVILSEGLHREAKQTAVEGSLLPRQNSGVTTRMDTDQGRSNKSAQIRVNPWQRSSVTSSALSPRYPSDSARQRS